MIRKQRIEIIDSLGRSRSLDQGGMAFVNAGLGGDEAAPVLLLGLGPEPAKALQRFAPSAWVESEDFLQALARSRGVTPDDLLPAEAKGWRLDAEQAPAYLRRHKPKVILYRQGPLLFPEFWRPLLSRLQIAALPEAKNGSDQPCVLLPGRPQDLLHQDLLRALTDLGYRPISFDPGLGPKRMGELILRERPQFCLSVNLHGLDPGGESFYLLRELEIPLAIWFVDNPWLILSRLRLDWWKQAFLFVTGKGFVDDLRKHGANQVWHLPLAASDYFCNPKPAPLPAHTRIVFAGRASFPDKDKYFRAAHLPDDLLAQARALDAQADFNWWRDKLLLSRLWPGQQARQAGLGAESIGRERRIKWLSAASGLGLRLYGGGEWPQLLPPGTDIQPPVDYYSQLPGIYRAAPFCLNLTSPLLPGALTQRNFDVWRAGGFLLCPPEPGLDIFPEDLIKFSIINNPEDLDEAMQRLSAAPKAKAEIINAWQTIIKESHTYQLRIQCLIEKMSLLDRV